MELNYKSLLAPADYKSHWNEKIKVEEYHADKSAVNSSSLKAMIKSPKAFHESFYGDKTKVTKAMGFGTLAHMAILQGDEFTKRYVVQPEFESKTADGKPSDSKNTKFYKDQVDSWKASLSSDSIIVTQEELAKLLGMIDSIKNHAQAMQLLSQGKPELSGYWRDVETGILCRMQADFVSFNLGALVDVKTTSDCSWLDFRRSVEGYDYPFQLAMYAEGIKNITGQFPKACFWIAIENEAPYDVAVYQADDIYIQLGQYQYRKAMDKLKECIDTGKFSGIQTSGECEVTEPSFIYKEKHKEFLATI